MARPCFCFGVQSFPDEDVMDISTDRYDQFGFLSSEINEAQINLIKEDLENRPQWPLSSFAVLPGTASDITGDISFEELRCHELRQVLIEGKSIDEVKHNTFQLAWEANQKFENFAKKILEMQECDFSFGIKMEKELQDQVKFGTKCNQNMETLNRNHCDNNIVFGNSGPGSMECQPGSEFFFEQSNNNHNNNSNNNQIPSFQPRFDNIQFDQPSTSTQGFHFDFQNNQPTTPVINDIGQQQEPMDTSSIHSKNEEEEGGGEEATSNNEEVDPIVKNAKNLFHAKPWKRKGKLITSSSMLANRTEGIRESDNLSIQDNNEDEDNDMSAIPSTSDPANRSSAINSEEDSTQNKKNKKEFKWWLKDKNFKKAVIPEEGEIHENPWTAEFFSYIPEDPPPIEYCSLV